MPVNVGDRVVYSASGMNIKNPDVHGYQGTVVGIKVHPWAQVHWDILPQDQFWTEHFDHIQAIK